MVLRGRLTRIHFLIPIGLSLVAICLGAITGESVSDGFLPCSGPFLGGFLRDWQSCGTGFSWWLAYRSIAAVLVAFALQVAIRPGRILSPVRYLIWTAALIGWFAASILSATHAVS